MIPVSTKARFALLRAGYSYAAVARRIGITRTMVYHIVRGTSRTPWIREAIAKLLNKDPSELWSD